MAMERAAGSSGLGETTVGKLPAHHVLFRHGNDVCKAKGTKAGRYDPYTCAVNGRINDFQVVVTLDGVRRQGNGLDLADKGVVDFFSDDLDEVLVAFKPDILCLDQIDFVDDIGVVGRNDLGAIVPVCLVSVVFFGIVGGGQDDTALTSELANGKRHFRSGTEVFEKIDFDTVG